MGSSEVSFFYHLVKGGLSSIFEAKQGIFTLRVALPMADTDIR
jgi:hypothetical protein